MDFLGLALAYADVRLMSSYSDGDLASNDLTSRFSRRVGLKLPIVSAPMDTVTESKMAIAMAMAGCLGIIHRNMPAEQQVTEVKRTKFFLHAQIEKPIFVFGDQKINSIENYRREKGFDFHSFPVIDRETGRLIGILTRNDFDFCQDHNLCANLVMTKEPFTAPAGTILQQAHWLMLQHKKKVLPLVKPDGSLDGMYVFSDVERIVTGSHASYNIDEAGHLRVGAAIGADMKTIEPICTQALALARARVDVLVVDTSHADSPGPFEVLKRLKNHPEFSAVDIVVGNVSEGDSAKRLADLGADGIKVGQGPGSICTTRLVTGVGCPQVTAAYNCAKAIRGSGIPICADGGIQEPGDVSVAVGAGAESVMIGNLLARTYESAGERIVIKDIPHKRYRGMGSIGAMLTSKASRERYGERASTKDELVPEGIEGAVVLKGPVAAELHQLAEGLRRGMGMVGAKTILELVEKADFRRMTIAGLQESKPHGMEYIQPAPNYSTKEVVR